MFEIMLCGAHDVSEISKPFIEVAHDFGATPWWYLDGKIHYVNSANSSWRVNSIATVKKADICVFVILAKYGDITWHVELDEALRLGKPFLVLSLESSWLKYTTLLHSISDSNTIRSDDDKNMMEIIRKINDYQFTVEPFSYDTFKATLRSSLSKLIYEGITLLQTRNERRSALESLKPTGSLSRPQVNQLVALASDEDENKRDRKAALARLASNEERDDDFIRTICTSDEQGVQRLGFDLMPLLVRQPLDDDLLRELAQIAARTSDVAIARRLTSSVVKLAPERLDALLEYMGHSEEGVRRRAYEGIEENWDRVVPTWGHDRTTRFLRLCEGKSPMKASWLERLRKRLTDLEPENEL